MREIFINDFGRLRSGWRLLIFGAAFIALTFVITTVLRIPVIFVLGRTTHFIDDLVFRVGLLSSALGAGYFCVRFLEGLPWRSLGLTFHSGWLRDLIFGFVIGFASLVVAVAIASKGFKLSLGDNGWYWIVRSGIGSAALFFLAALAEEAMFRGYGLQTLSRAKLAWLGVLLTSVPFGLVHLNNPNVVPVVTMTNTVLAGIWLAAAYLRTRSLWLAVGVHWSWNWALGWFFGLPVSGMTIVSNPLVEAQDLGPKWLTGGTYGIEGGVACTIALILFTVFLWKTRWLSATPELKQMTSEENPATSEPVISIRPDHA
ncbi:MAG: protease family protein [Acidobacteriota bacterium]|jgi:membrane protease YdiL (CAAX protease family)